MNVHRICLHSSTDRRVKESMYHSSWSQYHGESWDEANIKYDQTVCRVTKETK